MTQLDKLEMLNSHWKSFANCKNDSVKEYVKNLMIYMMSRGRICQLEKITSNGQSIFLRTKKFDRSVEIFIYGESDCDILFYETGDTDTYHTYALDSVCYFGIAEVLIEMFFFEGRCPYD